MVVTDHPGKFVPIIVVIVIVIVIVLNGKDMTSTSSYVSRTYLEVVASADLNRPRSRGAPWRRGGGIKTLFETTDSSGSPSPAKIIARVPRHEGLAFDTVGHRGSSASGVREGTAARRRKPG